EGARETDAVVLVDVVVVEIESSDRHSRVGDSGRAERDGIGSGFVAEGDGNDVVAFLVIIVRALHGESARAEGDGAGGTRGIAPVDQGAVVADGFGAAGIGKGRDGLTRGGQAFGGGDGEGARGSNGGVAGRCGAVHHGVGGG